MKICVLKWIEFVTLKALQDLGKCPDITLFGQGVVREWSLVRVVGVVREVGKVGVARIVRVRLSQSGRQ